MLFSKLKPKSDELLPPPPPFPSMELEEKPSREHAEKRKAKAPKDDFDGLFKEFESLKLQKEVSKIKQKPKKIEKKTIAKIKPAKIKPLKKTKLAKKLPQIKIKASAIKPVKSAKPKISEEFEFPAEEPKIEEIEFPELEEKEPLEFESAAAKPKEIQEAEDEIKSAIEKIKNREKPSFFNKLFGKKEPEIMEKPAADDVLAIKSHIESARQALMNFDLDAARKNYIEIMRIYNSIAPEEQAKVYQEIQDLYSERKSAEELKV